jgi:hypothetical protein
MTTGASLMYTQSFNEFKDLLRKARNKKKEKETPVDDTGQNKTAVKKDDESD